MAEESAISFGDRVELAIERHADTAGEIRRGEQAPSRRALVRTIVWLAVTLVSLYVVFPSLLETFSSWRQITRFSWQSLAGMVALQAGVMVCMFDLGRVALRSR